MSADLVLDVLFEGATVRVVGTPEEPWFVVTDVCRVLGHSDPSMAVREFDDGEKGTREVCTLKGTRRLLVVSEPGLYRLIIASKVPGAKRFQRLVFHEVLPSIRKTGTIRPAIDLTTVPGLRAIVAQLAQQAIEAAPKVEFYDRLAQAGGRENLQNAARILGQRHPNLFIKRLEADGFLFRQGGSLVPYQQHMEAGLFEVRVHVDSSEHERRQTYVSPRGLQCLAEVYPREVGSNVLSITRKVS